MLLETPVATSVFDNVVLILIVLEDALGGQGSLCYRPTVQGLNPYCVGRCSWRPRTSIQDVKVRRLNPYCVGRCSWREYMSIRHSFKRCLNPYCVGRCSWRPFKSRGKEQPCLSLNPYCVGRCSWSWKLVPGSAQQIKS